MSITRTLALGSLCIGSLGAAAAAQTASQRGDTALLAGIRSFVDAESVAGRFSGVVVVARSGESILELARGQANRKTSLANAIGTRFQLASGDKWFTKIAISQLVAAGKVALTDTVGKFLPAYPNAIVRSKAT